MEIKRYQAAGGIVVCGGNILLLRKRQANEIVLPKGHIEPGEKPDETALRETREETGYQNLRLLTNLGTRRAEFTQRNRRVIRDETYFVMELLDDQISHSPDYDDARQDRETFEVCWAPLDEAATRLTFEPARTFVRQAVAWLQQRI